MPRELIYKDEALGAILQTNSMFAYCINNIKPVDAVEVVHGRWIARRFTETLFGCECSNCHTTWDAETNYCPNCGAKMDGGNEDGK